MWFPGSSVRLTLASLGLGRRRVNNSLDQHITRSSTVVAAVGSSTERKFEWILREPTSRFEMTAEQATNFCVLYAQYLRICKFSFRISVLTVLSCAISV